MSEPAHPYTGRLAPTPTGYLHLGHGRTFWAAWSRARQAGGALIYREEDIDPSRCRPEFALAARHDLRWLGLDWDHGPDSPGGEACIQSSRHHRGIYLEAWKVLHAAGLVYPCRRTRREIALATAFTPHPDRPDEEPVYPPAWRPQPENIAEADLPGSVNWRFRVPDGQEIAFEDLCLGHQTFTADRDFGDFLVWRKDGVPSYELAVVVDDIAMRITEVVRGEDLVKSTARQLLLYRALGANPPRFFHCPLVRDPRGRRLAKRHQDLGLRHLRQSGVRPEALLQSFAKELKKLGHP